MDKAHFENLKGYFESFRTLPEHNIQELFDELGKVFTDTPEPKPKKPKATKTEAE